MTNSPSSPTQAASLPRSFTPLISREREVTQLCNVICQGDTSLVTLTGPGGVGKTTLTIAAARGAAKHFPDGVALVSLATITATPRLVASSIARRLCVQETNYRRPEETFTAHLRDKRLLHVLDNFEQVVEEAPLVADLLGECPRLTVLVTGRVRGRP